MALASYSLSTPWLQIWHERMGHLGEQNLLKLKGMSYGMSDVPEACLCEACVLGRMKEGPIRSLSKLATNQLKLIHTNMQEQFPVPVTKGKRNRLPSLIARTSLQGPNPIPKGTE